MRHQDKSQSGNPLFALVEQCLESEHTRGLSPRSLNELNKHLNNFARFSDSMKIFHVRDLTPRIFEDFVQSFECRQSRSLTKAVVWAVRKFGAYLALLQALPDNPAKHLHHPMISPRAKLPRYLKPDELYRLLEVAMDSGSLQNLCVMSLLATVGPRPHEIAMLRIKDVNVAEHFLMLRVKGNWYKRTAISAAMAETLSEYLDENAHLHDTDRMFYNRRGAPIDRRWVLRMVNHAAHEAGVGPITPRVFRHTFGTFAADRHGKEITRALMGHASGKNTDVYMHLVPSKFRRIMNMHPYQTSLPPLKKASASKRRPTSTPPHATGGAAKALPDAPAPAQERALIEKYVHNIQNIRCMTPHTVKRHRTIVNKFSAYCRRRGVRDLTHAQNEDMVSWIALREQTVCGRTIARELGILRSFYEYGIAFHGPCADPFTGLPKFISGPSPEQPVLRVEDLHQLLSSCDRTNAVGVRNHVLIALMWSTGLRSGELCNLQWRDIDLDDGTLLVRKGKGRKQRQLLLNTRIHGLLKEYRHGMLWGEKKPVIATFSNTSSRKGIFEGRLTTNRLSKIISDIAHAAGIRQRVTAKIIRHCFATHLYDAGVSINDIKELMGHQDRTETAIYVHVSLDAIKHVLNRHVGHTLFEEAL